MLGISNSNKSHWFRKHTSILWPYGQRRSRIIRVIARHAGVRACSLPLFLSFFFSFSPFIYFFFHFDLSDDSSFSARYHPQTIFILTSNPATTIIYTTGCFKLCHLKTMFSGFSFLVFFSFFPSCSLSNDYNHILTALVSNLLPIQKLLI